MPIMVRFFYISLLLPFAWAWFRAVEIYTVNEWWYFFTATTTMRPFVFRIFTTLPILIFGRLGASTDWLYIVIVAQFLAQMAAVLWLWLALAADCGASPTRTAVSLFWGLVAFGLFLVLHHFYPYDSALMALWLLALRFAHKQQWRQWALTVAAATLVKETALFLIIVGWAQGAPRAHLARAALYHATIRAVFMAVFYNLPGENMEWHVWHQLDFILTGGPWAIGYYGALLALLVAVAWHWQSKPPVLRAVVIVAPIYLALYLMGGVPLEGRATAELFPALWLLAMWPVISPTGAPSSMQSATTHLYPARSNSQTI